MSEGAVADDTAGKTDAHKPFAGKIALVTGASRGIGRALALGLGAGGAHVVALARTVGALEELDDEIRAAGGEPITLVAADLKDLPALDRLGAALHSRWGRLDVLVGNAGILGPLTPVSHLEPKALEDVLTINVTANARLIRSLDPLLRQSEHGRAIFLTSSAAWRGRAFWGAYAASKAALDALVRAYAAETEKTPLRVNLVNPGATRTRMRKQAMPGEDPELLPPPADLVPPLLELLKPSFTETGRVYDFPTQTLMGFRAPAPLDQV